MKRENRYVVMKRTDIVYALSPVGRERLNELLEEVATARMLTGKKPLECVVVESDWPEYEPTWRAIEERVDGADLLSTPTDDNAVLALQFCKEKLIRKLARLEPTNSGQYYHDDINQFVKVAKAIVGEMDK